MFWIGLLVAASVSVGRYVGAGNAAAAARAAKAVAIVALSSGCAASLVIAAFRTEISGAYTQDESTRALSAQLLVVLRWVEGGKGGRGGGPRLQQPTDPPTCPASSSYVMQSITGRGA